MLRDNWLARRRAVVGDGYMLAADLGLAATCNSGATVKIHYWRSSAELFHGDTSLTSERDRPSEFTASLVPKEILAKVVLAIAPGRARRE